MGRLIPQSHSQDRVELSYRLSQIASAPVAHALLITYILYHISVVLSMGFRKIFSLFLLSSTTTALSTYALCGLTFN